MKMMLMHKNTVLPVDAARSDKSKLQYLILNEGKIAQK
jgi:hypothetical protein